MGLESNQYFMNLPPHGGNPHWNSSQLQGQYPWNGQILGNYQPCWIPHPQGGNSPFNSFPQWNGKNLGNNQSFWGSSIEVGDPPWDINPTLGKWNYQFPPTYQTPMVAPIRLPFLSTLNLPNLSQLTNDLVLHMNEWLTIPTKLFQTYPSSVDD